MYGYIYLTTNLVNGKKYIGKRSKDFYKDPKYLGSGKLIIKAISKYGRENFVKELIEECESLEKLNEREKFWISFYNAKDDPMFYNIHPGGDGGDISLYIEPDEMKIIRDNHSKYIKDRLENDEEFHDRFSGAKQGHIVTDNTKDSISESLKEVWNNRDEETKHDILSRSALNRNKGRVWMTNDIEDEFVKDPERVEYLLMIGHRFGRKFKHRERKCATTIESVAN